jgi:hypothetical protein
VSLNNPSWGEGYVPAYQMSGMPFVTSSNVALGAVSQIEFKYVTKFFTIKNTGASTNVIAVGFTQNGLLPENSNYFTLSGSEAFSGEIRTSALFVSGAVGASTSYSLVAGLTNIPVSNFLTVTASNGFGGVG